MSTNDETYLLLVLADSNLPTGAFVASSGLESSLTHGQHTKDTLLAFIQDSLASYSRSALPYLSDAYDAASAGCINDLIALDKTYDAQMLNHIARRASTAQGIALLSLYSKGLAPPASKASAREKDISALVDTVKMTIRREQSPGHLPICFGILTAALGLSLERSQHLHLFLHARGLISAAIRMNTIGPYAGHQLLLHSVQPSVEAAAVTCAPLRSGILNAKRRGDWDDFEDGPANTWPLGEILASRHDLQHSRIFNS